MCDMEGWKETTIKDEFYLGRGRVISQSEIEDNDGIYPVYSSQSTNKGEMGKISTFDFEGEYITWTTDGAYAGTVFHRNGKFNCTNVCGTLKAIDETKIDHLFVAYLLSTISKGHVSYVGNPKLMNGVMSKIPISIPYSLKEQKKIASILSTIDQTIDQTEQLIAKYKNIKQGLMHDLLTYGIDENGTIRNPQTHTFVEKKGMIVPEKWEVEELSEHILLLNGGTPSTSNPDFWNGNIPWLSVDDFNTGKRFVYDANKKITEKGLKYSSTRLLVVNDIIISARGTVGVIAQLGKEMAFNQSCYGIRNDSKKIYANDFIYFYLKFYFQSKGVIKTGSTFDTITKNTFDEIFISLPSKTEQQKIVSILEQHDNLIESEQTNLAKLQNMKQGLMADLLTGKVRVKI